MYIASEGDFAFPTLSDDTYTYPNIAAKEMCDTLSVGETKYQILKL